MGGEKKWKLKHFIKWRKGESFTADQRAQIINECVEDHVSPVDLAKKYSVTADTIRAWVRRAGKTLPKWYRYQCAAPATKAGDSQPLEVQKRGGTPG